MPKAGGFLPISAPSQRHHAYITTIGGEAVSDNAAWLHTLDRESGPEEIAPLLDLTPPQTREAAPTPQEKAAATRQHKADLAAAKASASARQQARRERYQRWAERFPETARQRLMWFDRAVYRRQGLKFLHDDDPPVRLHVHQGHGD